MVILDTIENWWGRRKVHFTHLFHDPLNMQDTMMMGADGYQTDAEIASLLENGKVPIGVGENTKIRYHDVT